MAEIVIQGLDELLARLQTTPMKVRRIMSTSMQATLLKLWESVPSYPPPPANTDYVRTGTLGRTLGAGGTPAIYEVKEFGDYVEGDFGTNLEYAPYVVGDYDTQQASHMRHWWTLPQDVLNRAMDGIEAIWSAVAEEIADYIAGKGG